MIKFKDFVNATFDTHEDAMRVLGVSKTSFYRRMKDDNWMVFEVKKNKADTDFYITKIDCKLSVHCE